MNIFIGLSVVLISLAHAERWDDNNHPNHFNKITETPIIMNYDLLPLVGRLDDERLGWSETYWPSNKGGIAFRWNHPNPMPFAYDFHSKEELKSMTIDELEKLSPSELYDISQGDYTYSLTRKTLSQFTPQNLWWEGICHGWSQAAANYPEPTQVIIRNPDGILVPFGSSDVKGLLAMHDSYNSQGVYTHIGGRCNAAGKVPGEGSSRDTNVRMPPEAKADSIECRDVNAGSFHIVISNMIGIQSKSLVADVDRFADVWNQPVVAYNSVFKEELAVEESHHTSGVARRLRMDMKMTYGEELQFHNQAAINRGEVNFVSKLPVTRTQHQGFRSKNYEYILELDSSHNIIGGEWISETRPDFLWIKKRDQKFLDTPMPLKGLSLIYRPVRY